MVKIMTMVGEIEVDDNTDWGDESKMADAVRSELKGNGGNIRVCIRVRPPNQRELALPGGVIVNVPPRPPGAISVARPDGEAGEPRNFMLDITFPFTIGQLECFQDVGVEIVQTAYQGFNASLFAYGQTSSGKSFSMMGVRGTALVGLIPRIAHLLFYTILTDTKREFFVEGSYLEIYNEMIKDLMDKGNTESLKVRESPQLGVHVAGLSRHHVKTSDDCEKLIEDGTGNRTVAATKYNSESSRSHAVFELHIQQKYVDTLTMEEMNSNTKICLIDLAGSERSDKLGSVGTALKEGNNINKSLTVLGRCIKGLVEQCNNPKKKIQVPFRESVLTWYLRDSLAGNSRTTMLACCSPAGSNEEETLSTLRYAASAKQIKTSAVKQEDPLKAKVRELSEEVERLKKALQASGARLPDAPDDSGGGGGEPAAAAPDAPLSPAHPDRRPTGEYIATLNDEEREAYLQELQSALAGLMPGGFTLGGTGGSFSEGGAPSVHGRQESLADAPVVTYPLLSCLNKDDLLSHAMKIAILPPDDGALQFTVGRSGGARENDFTLNGVGMQVRHAAFHLARVGAGGDGDDTVDEGDLGRRGHFVQSCVSGASVMVNGAPLPEGGRPQRLAHGDRITFGPCRMLALWCERPLSTEELNAWSYDAAFQELMGHESIAWALLSPVRRRLLDKLKEAEILFVEQANAIAAEMSTAVRFHATVVLGDGVRRLHASHAAVDDLIADGDDGGPGAEVVVVCTVVRAGDDERRAALAAREQAAKEAVRRDHRRMLGSMPNPPSFLDDTLALDEELGRASGESIGLFDRFDMGSSDLSSDLDPGSAPGPARSQGVHRGMSINMFHNTLETLAEDDDDDLMAGVHDLSDPADYDDEGGGTSSGVRGRSAAGGAGGFGSSSFGGAISGRESHVLFSMKMDKFEDLVSELKQTYAHLGSLSYGVQEVAASGGARYAPGMQANIVSQIFDTICADDAADGTITRSDLSAAFNLFDETSQDPGFAKRMMRDLLPAGVSHLDYETFAAFLTKFVQHQLYDKLEPYVSNQALFVSIGGRDVSAVIDAERAKGERFEQRTAALAEELEATNAHLSAAQREVKVLQARLAQLREENAALAEDARVADSATVAAQQAGGVAPLPPTSGEASGSPSEAKSRPQPSKKKSSVGLSFEADAADPAVARPGGGLKKKTSGLKDSDAAGLAALAARPGQVKKKKSWSVFSAKLEETEELEASLAEASLEDNARAQKTATFAGVDEPAGAEPSGPATAEPERPKFGRPRPSKTSPSLVAIGEDSSVAGGPAGPRSILDEADPMGTWLGKLGLSGYRGEIEALGIYALKDLLNPDMVGEDELLEAGFEDEEVDLFNDARQETRVTLNLTPPRVRPLLRGGPPTRRPLGGGGNSKFYLDAADQGDGGQFAPSSEFGSFNDDTDASNSVFQNHRGNSFRFGDGLQPEFVQQPLEQLLRGPVVLVNWRSKRKLYAQTCKKPTVFETWAKGFGAGPELKTFKDNKWWLLPQGDRTFVVVNGYSSRKLFAKPLKRGAKWELSCGAGPSEDTTPDTLWRIEQDPQTGAFVVQNVASSRKLFARMPHRGDKWSAGVGGAPAEHTGTETLWNIMPDDATGADGVSDPAEFSRVWASHLQQADEPPPYWVKGADGALVAGEKRVGEGTADKSKSHASKSRSNSQDRTEAVSETKPETKRSSLLGSLSKKKGPPRSGSSDDVVDGGLDIKRSESKMKEPRGSSVADVLDDDDDISSEGKKKPKKKTSRAGSEDDILDGGDLKKKEKKKKAERLTKSNSAEDVLDSDLSLEPLDVSKNSAKPKDVKKKSPRAGGADDLSAFNDKNSAPTAALSAKGERPSKKSPARDRPRELSKQHSNNHFQEDDDPYL